MTRGTDLHRFRKLFPDPLSTRIVDAVFYDLHDAWTEPHRVYHTVEHLRACLQVIDEMPIGHCPNPHAAADAEIAIWWHDAVYKVDRSATNEIASAQWFDRVSDVLGIHEIRPIAIAIFATCHKPEVLPNPTDHPVATYVCDVDLAILGDSPAAYDRYAAQIRREYRHVSDVDYRRGRAEILRKLLARQTLYHREDFRERFERTARENLAREIGSLFLEETKSPPWSAP